MACELMSCNAEIHRIEDTIKRIGIAYGAAEMNVLAITTSIVVTMVMPDGERLTETKRIQKSSAFHFAKMIRLNALSRDFCSGSMTQQEFGTRLKEIASGENKDPNTQYLLHMDENLNACIGSIIISGSFALFFGGTLYDGIAGLFCGLLCYLFQQRISKKAPNQLIFQLLNALLIGLVIEAICSLVPGLHIDKITIGVIMLLIPGMAMTNAVKDILTGETITGSLRLVETIMWAGALAGGFMVCMTITSGSVEVYNGGQIAFVPHLLLAFIGALGFSIAFSVPGRYLFWASLGGMICWAVYLIGINTLGLSIFLASLLGTIISAVYGELTASQLRIPAPVMLIPAFIPLVPGSGLYYTMWSAVSRDTEQMQAYGLDTLMCALGMALGMSLVFAFYEMYVFKKK